MSIEFLGINLESGFDTIRCDKPFDTLQTFLGIANDSLLRTVLSLEPCLSTILRKTDRTLSKGEDVVVCLPGARIEHVTERVENVLGHGQGGSILVHVGTNNADRDGTTRIVKRYRELVETLKKTRVEQ